MRWGRGRSGLPEDERGSLERSLPYHLRDAQDPCQPVAWCGVSMKLPGLPGPFALTR